MSTLRRYYFEPAVRLPDAIRTILSALDDEGLALAPRGAKSDDIISVLADGQRVVLVPESRVMPRVVA